jgi:large subunit ribosomal protein L13
MKTSTVKPPAPEWVILDAEGQNLGRLSAKVASVLRGKHRPTFSPHAIYGDHVVVINASKLAIHPVKMRRKVYSKHSGYIGHLKTVGLDKLFEEKPVSVIERAVRGMLPKNRLRNEMMKRLHVFAESEHPHEAQQPQVLTITK